MPSQPTSPPTRPRPSLSMAPTRPRIVLPLVRNFKRLGIEARDQARLLLHGHMLGHVKDLGEEYGKVRGYMTRAHMAQPELEDILQAERAVRALTMRRGGVRFSIDD